MAQSYKYVCLGGGNASGYLAKELVAGGLKAGELCIITEEPVRVYCFTSTKNDGSCCGLYISDVETIIWIRKPCSSNMLPD